MYNSHTMYLIGKERMADFHRAADLHRQATGLRERRPSNPMRLILGVAGRLTIVVGLLIGMNVNA